MEVSDQLAATAAPPNRTPPGDELGMEAMAANLKHKLFGSEVERPRFGRFEVRREVGSGGMGVVYEGWDPDLERKVALKVLHGRSGDTSAQRKRLVREAQTLAKLRHPNVVQVYEVGVQGDRFFIAMEFVEGETLREWIARGQPQWREVLDKYVEAGRGLAAAHAEGLVHRDFKPDNVMVTTEGEVRVLDFGLARDEFDAQALSLPADMRADEITQTGALLGTPVYMAPEQFRTKPADARSDQYAFCVALWEGLYGQRPFRGKTLEELAQQVTSGTMDMPPKRDVPGWLRKATLRGMSVDGDARFATMAQLLSALTPRRRSPWAIAGGLAGLAGLGIAAAVVVQQPEPAPPCPDPALELAGIWDEPAQARLEAAVLASEREDAAAQWARVETNVDTWADAWVSESRDNCEATRIHHTQSPEQMHLRQQCLQARLQNLDALLQGISDDPRFRPWAAPMTKMLPKVSGCRDAKTAEMWPPLPEDPKARQSAMRLRAKVALMQLLPYISRSLLQEVTSEIREDVERSDDGPLRAQFYLASKMASDSGPQAWALAFSEGERTGDDRTAALAAAALVGCGRKVCHGATPDRWREIALAKAERLGDDPELMIMVRNRVHPSLPHDERLRETEALAQAGLALDEDHPYAYVLVHSHGIILMDAHRSEEALEVVERALDRARAALGPESFGAVSTASTLSMVQGQMGHCEEVKTTIDDHILPFFEAATEVSLVNASNAVQHCDPGLARDLAALARKAAISPKEKHHAMMFEGFHGLHLGFPPSPEFVAAVEALGDSEDPVDRSNRRVALAHIGRITGDYALALSAADEYRDDPRLQEGAQDIHAWIHLVAGKPAAALQALSESDRSLDGVSKARGWALSELGRHEEAIEELSRHRPALVASGDPVKKQVAFALAKSLAATGDLESAVEIVSEIPGRLEGTGPAYAGFRDEVDAWFDQHRPGDFFGPD